MTDKKRSIILAILLLNIILGALLRFYGLENQSMWNDELDRWFITHDTNLSQMFEHVIEGDVHPPGDHIFMYFWQKYIGDSVFLMRLPSVIWGILAIPAMFLLGRQLFSEVEGVIASSMTAVLYFPIYYSQEARPYSLLFLMAIMTTYFWIKLLRSSLSGSKIKPLELVLYLLLAWVTVYQHYFGTFLIFLQGIAAFIVLFADKKNAAVFIIIYGIILLSFIPWINGFLGDLKVDDNYISRPEWYFTPFFFGVIFNRSLFVLAPIAFLYIYFFYFLIKKNENDDALVFKGLSSEHFILIWLFVPFIILYIKSLISAPVLTYKNLMIIVPAAYLIPVRALAELPVKSTIKYIAVSAFIVYLLIHLIFIFGYYKNPEPKKAEFRSAVNYVVKNNPKKGGSVVVGCAHRKEYFNFYFNKLNTNLRAGYQACEASDTLKIDSIVKKREPDYLWFISGHINPDKKFIEYLDQKFELKQKKKLFNAQARLYEAGNR